MNDSLTVWHRAIILLLCVCSFLAAADATTDNKAKAFLGVTLATAADSMFEGKGLAVLRTEPNSPAAVMGITAGDRLLSFDGVALASQDDLGKLMGARKPGDTIKLEIHRTKGKDQLPEILAVSGVLKTAPQGKVQSLSEQLADNAHRLAELEKAKGPSLGEVLQKIRDIEKDLPLAAEAFKKIYPNGEFKIAISIEITSDKTAKDPLNIDVNGKPTEAPKPVDPPKE